MRRLSELPFRLTLIIDFPSRVLGQNYRFPNDDLSLLDVICGESNPRDSALTRFWCSRPSQNVKTFILMWITHAVIAETRQNFCHFLAHRWSTIKIARHSWHFWFSQTRTRLMQARSDNIKLIVCKCLVLPEPNKLSSFEKLECGIAAARFQGVPVDFERQNRKKRNQTKFIQIESLPNLLNLSTRFELTSLSIVNRWHMDPNGTTLPAIYHGANLLVVFSVASIHTLLKTISPATSWDFVSLTRTTWGSGFRSKRQVRR
jgi:hypothetical protein